MSMPMPNGLLWANAIAQASLDVDKAKQAALVRQKMAHQDLQSLTGMFDLQYGSAKSSVCPNCGRSKQTPNHNTCDGCGAPK